LLRVLNFPPDVAQRINDARGDVNVTCPSSTKGSFSNKGKKINENVPGAGRALAIELSENVSGDMELSPDQIMLDNLKGITADGPGPFNFDLDAITVTSGIVDIDL